MPQSPTPHATYRQPRAYLLILNNEGNSAQPLNQKDNSFMPEAYIRHATTHLCHHRRTASRGNRQPNHGRWSQIPSREGRKFAKTCRNGSQRDEHETRPISTSIYHFTFQTWCLSQRSLRAASAYLCSPVGGILSQ